MSHPEYVDAKDVRFLALEPISMADGSQHLRLKGLIFHSALAVQDVEIRTDGPNYWVMIKLTPTAKGLKGSFDFNVPLETTNRAVVFGPSKFQIWPKQSAK